MTMAPTCDFVNRLFPISPYSSLLSSPFHVTNHVTPTACRRGSGTGWRLCRRHLRLSMAPAPGSPLQKLDVLDFYKVVGSGTPQHDSANMARLDARFSGFEPVPQLQRWRASGLVRTRSQPNETARLHRRLTAGVIAAVLRATRRHRLSVGPSRYRPRWLAARDSGGR